MGCSDWREAQLGDCKQWADEGYSKCSEERDNGYNRCTQERDDGYNTCAEYRDKGYSACSQRQDRGHSSCSQWDANCCTWWPCSWACKLITWVCGAWVWISNVVCVAWTWLSNVVCVAWTWIKNVVCVAWTWFKNVVCVAWTWFKNLVCVAWTEIRSAYCHVFEAVFGWCPLCPKPVRTADVSNLPPFPPGFYWGAATAGYQVEGGIENNDWHHFTTSPGCRDRVGRLGFLAGTSIELKPPGRADDHQTLATLSDDLDRAELLGLNAYRLSIEWSRIEPTKDGGWSAAGLLYYSNVIDAVRARGLKPVVTLNHMTLPEWVLMPPPSSWVRANHADAVFQASLRGWENWETVDRFIAFVDKVVREYKDRVDTWITLNEPVGSMVGVGYLAGIWSPGFTAEGTLGKEVYFHLLRAHVRAYDAIKAIYGSAPSQVGIAHAMMYAKTAGGSVGTPALIGAGIGALVGAAVGGGVGAVVGGGVGAVAGLVAGGLVALQNQHEAARNQFDYFYNWHLLDSLISGTVDTAIHRRDQNRTNVDAREFYELPAADPWHARLDFVGVNFYRSVYVAYDAGVATVASYSGGTFEQDYNKSSAPHNLVNEMGWEISPEGLYFLLTDIQTRYRIGNDQPIPTLVTENGLPEHADQNRAPYIVAHLEHVLAAVRDGARVLGYLHWSLVDNFEWHENYKPKAKFGLFRVDDSADEDHISPAGLRREITEGALALQYVIAETKAAPGGGGGGPATHVPTSTNQVRGMGQAVYKYGTITSNGSAVVAPELTAGAVFACQGMDGPFLLYLNQLSTIGGASGAQRWLGMVYLTNQGRWHRLHNVAIDDPSGPGEPYGLRFDHGAGAQARAYQAAASPSGLVGTYPAASGSWYGTKVTAYGSWATSQATTRGTVQLHGFNESQAFGSWVGKHFDQSNNGLPIWKALRNPTVTSGGAVRGEFSDWGEFLHAQVTGNSMSGRVEDRNGHRLRPWTAGKRPDAMPF
jgi:beta-glucosidase/6-phospho-beta-glucosidase/beta-galactosidase